MKKLGIIAGQGTLPLEVALRSKVDNIECYIAFITDEIDNGLLEFHHQLFGIGSAGKIISYFKQNGIEHLVFCGKINRPNLLSIQVDPTGAILLAKILKHKLYGDDNILRTVADFLEQKGFRVLSAQDILSNTNNFKNIGRITKQNLKDIEIGIEVLNTISHLDIGQAIILQNNYVLGIEAAEGTDRLIERCAPLRKTDTGGVLIKIMKKTQDSRLDIPTIGPHTIDMLAKYKYDGIAIQTQSVIILEQEKTIQMAQKAKVFMHSL